MVHKSLSLVEHRIHLVISKLVFSKSYFGITYFGLQMNICQSLINSYPYCAANFGIYSMEKMEASLEKDEFIDFSSPMNWAIFNTEKGLYFSNFYQAQQ